MESTTKGPPVGLVTLLPRTEPQQAVLHVYASLDQLHRDDQQRGSLQFLDEAYLQRATTLCAMDVPSHLPMADFLLFVAPVEAAVSHYRVIRDATPHQNMILMTFRDKDTALQFYNQYNRRKFSSMEDDLCRLTYLQSMGVQSSIVSPFSFQTHAQDTIAAEHPNCPVCLDPMDEATTGLFTISCQHTFHVHCIRQWASSSCPVCRYSSHQSATQQASSSISSRSGGPKLPLLQDFSQPPDDELTNRCQVCDTTTNLWICLVCGHIGCGRVERAHALNHYRATNHIYSLEIETKRVWDYASDGYVHRLVQNVVDGKLVELPGEEDTSAEMVQGKVDAMAVEYSYLLTSQLDSQRIYYEDKIQHVMDDIANLSQECESLTAQLVSMQHTQQAHQRTRADLQVALQQQAKENAKLKQKTDTLKDKTDAFKQRFAEEKELAASLARNNDITRQLVDRIQEQIDTKTSQCQDLMVKLAQQEEQA
ncbi:hypothetical protein BC940DRAFT_281508 [Gongronella butleri]|nr:hypothetical protein BC940DRAFT_281508 [Gongronella butleri]